ncbi:MAG: hypothetical protein MK060_13495 [Blastomonas sp.]|uniref:hypothetical protein n=1 Tax=Blastomonas sp. TaxID=1909299 RepID=UPI00406A9A68|nr:hypothetical protein [Blastomonas sp.]
MKGYQEWLIDDAGNKRTNVSIEVRVANSTPGAGAKATIFSNAAGAAKANPFTNLADGSYSFFANDGRYDVVLNPGTVDQKIIAAVEVVDGLDLSQRAVRVPSGEAVVAVPPLAERTGDEDTVWAFDKDTGAAKALPVGSFPPGPQGPPGTNNTVATLEDLAALDTDLVSAIAAGATFIWKAGDYSALVDGVDYVASDDLPATTGAWVRIGQEDLRKLGEFSGSTIPDNQTPKQAMQALETAVETKATAAVVGVTATASNLGTFTSALIDDNQTVKAAIESIATNLASSDSGKGGSLVTLRRGLSVQREFDDLTYNGTYLMSSAIRDAVRAGTHSTAINEAIEDAFAAAAALNYTAVRLPEGIYPQAAGETILQIPAGMTLAGDPNRKSVIKMLGAITAGSTAPSFGAQQGQNIWMRAGSALVDIAIDGGGVGGGVVASVENNILCRNVHTFNGYGAQSFHLVGVEGFELVDISGHLNLFGTQIWVCQDGRIINPKFDQMVAGVFLAGSERVTCSNPYTTNMEDVGLDIEGGIDCKIEGGYSSACKNGELAIFRDGTREIGSGITKNNSITGVKVRRTATFVDRDGDTVATDTTLGAVYFASWDEGAIGVKVHNNDITVEAGAGYTWYLAGNQSYSVDAEFSNNKVRFEGTGALFNVPAKVPGFRHTGNEYLITAAVATSANFKNISGGAFDGNVFRCEVAPSDELIYFFTDAAMASPCSVNGNKFFGAGQFAARFDAFNAGDGVFICANNQWSDKPVVNGGITVSANGNPKWRNEVLLLSDEDTTNTTSTFDFGSLPFLSTPSFGTPYIRVDHAIHIGGAQRNQYDYYYTAGDLISANGSGSGSGKTSNPAFYITFSGDTATVTKTVAANQSVLTLTLNSMNY